MVWDQDPGKSTCLLSSDNFSESPQEIFPVPIVPKDLFSLDSSNDHMVQTSRGIQSEPSRHEAPISKMERDVKKLK